MHAFMTDKEFYQAAIDTVARFISERASVVISTGNVADIGQESLGYLEKIAVDMQLSPFVVSTYLEIIRVENQEILDFL